jgi:prephenate dehydrogenase
MSRRSPVVAVAGLGLIGGSLARALSAAGYSVLGVDREPVLRRARAARAISGSAPTVEEAARLADVVVLAAPPAANLRMLRRVARAARPGLTVTDVGSVQGPICREARRLGLVSFVAGHPIAGTEKRGFGASSAELFRGRAWALTPVGGDRAALGRVRALVRAAGARPVVVGAREHDRALAFLSHVPQIAAWALRGSALGDAVTSRNLGLAGPGFRDMTRLAGSPRGLWREILAENRVEVARALAAFRRALRRAEAL